MYRIGTKEQTARLRKILEKNHPKLLEQKVSIELVQAFAPVNEHGDPIGHALFDRGYVALAKIRVNAEKDRVKGLADVELVIDGDAWPDMSEPRRSAILDQQLTRLELRKASDDLGRPRLRVRPYDRAYFWMDSIAERWGEHSTEVRQASALRDDPIARSYFQMQLPLDIPASPKRERPRAVP